MPEDSNLTSVTDDSTKPCSSCGKRMVRRYANFVLATYPAQYPWSWWCSCGHTEYGGVDRGVTAEELLRIDWEQANAKEGR